MLRPVTSVIFSMISLTPPSRPIRPPAKGMDCQRSQKPAAQRTEMVCFLADRHSPERLSLLLDALQLLWREVLLGYRIEGRPPKRKGRLSVSVPCR